MDEQNTTLSTAEAAREELTLPPMPEPPAPPATVNVVDIHFRSGGKVYFFDPGDLPLQSGQHVIISTARGLEYGSCASGVHAVSKRDIVPPLRPVLRIATAADEKMMQESRDKEKRAFAVCQKKIAEHGLEMQLVSAECAFDGSKILFFFTADGRVDFRELVKTLASTFRTRIELRQIGVRDKAKMVGGLGICGRPFCCSEFLADFQPVSIKMAKVQNLSLNPTKISGTCGRLMCCLKYEQDAYEHLIKTSPKQDSIVNTCDGMGTVTESNLLKQTVKVRLDRDSSTVKTYQNTDICILRNGKGKKTDPPIPTDLPPLPKPEKKLPEPEEITMFDESALFGFSASQEEQPEHTERKRPARSEQRASEPRHKSRNRGDRRKSGGNAENKKPRVQQTAQKEGPQKDAAAKEGGSGENKKSRPRKRYYRGGKRSGGGQKQDG